MEKIEYTGTVWAINHNNPEPLVAHCLKKLQDYGIKKEDIGISLEGGCLIIKAEKKQEEVVKEATYYSNKRCFGDYFRSVNLPFPVDAEKVSSTLENGLLEIRLPKAEEAKSKRIEVKEK